MLHYRHRICSYLIDIQHISDDMKAVRCTFCNLSPITICMIIRNCSSVFSNWNYVITLTSQWSIHCFYWTLSTRLYSSFEFHCGSQRSQKAKMCHQTLIIASLRWWISIKYEQIRWDNEVFLNSVSKFQFSLLWQIDKYLK